MQVQATGRGYYYWVRQPGDVFEIPDGLFSAEWMVAVDPANPLPDTQPETPEPVVSLPTTMDIQ